MIFDMHVSAVKKSSLLFVIWFRCGFHFGKEEYSLWCRIIGRDLGFPRNGTV